MGPRLGFTRLANWPHYNYLKRQSQDPEKALKESREMADTLNFFSKGMYWREGSFTLEMEVTIVGRQRPHRQTFNMTFSQADANKLKENVAKIEDHLIAIASGKNEPAPQWTWVWPRIDPADRQLR